MSWKSQLTFSSKVYVEHQVGDKTLRFYPNRIGLLTEWGQVSTPIAKALATLFATDRSDAKSVQESYREKPIKSKAGESADSSVDKITVEPVSPEIADHRRLERDAAIQVIIDGVTNERSVRILGKLLMDSLRDVFPYQKDRSPADVEQFLFGDGDEYGGLDTPILVQMIQGWLKANSKVFGNVGEQVVRLVKGRLEALQGRSQPEPTTSQTDGSSSKTPSSEQSDSDSNSPT